MRFYRKALGTCAIASFLGCSSDDLRLTGPATPGPMNVALSLGAAGVAPSFKAPSFFPTGAGLPVRMAAGDFNNDGKRDVVVSVHYGGLSIFLGDGQGGFGPVTVFSAGMTFPTAVAVADFNRDGNADIVTGDVDRGFFAILLGDGSGRFGAPRTFPVGPGVYSIAVADYNLDGKLDAALASYPGFGNTVALLLGDGAGGFAAPQYTVVGGTPISVEAADFNHDNVPDLLVGIVLMIGNTTVLLGNGDGTFRPSASLPPAGAVSAADFDLDGNPDVVVAASDYVTAWLGRGDGTFAPAAPRQIVGISSNLVVGDFDGDGRPDIGSTIDWTGVFVSAGDGAGGFAPPTYFALGPRGSGGMSADDVNADGRLDMLVPLYSNTAFALFLSGPNTESGTNIAVVPTDQTTGAAGAATLTFSSITTAGTTSLTSSSNGAPLPAGFRLGSPPTYYGLSTTAVFSGPITVCIRYDPAAVGNENKLHLFHGNADGTWTDVTTSLDTAADVICGQVTSLSPFAVGEFNYGFVGFAQPVDNLPTLNGAKAGSAIPVKFSLSGNLGLGIFAPGSPTVVSIPCSSTSPTDDIEQVVAASTSGLTYDAATNQYTYVWKTDKAWVSTCRQLVVTLADGNDYRANFRFK